MYVAKEKIIFLAIVMMSMLLSGCSTKRAVPAGGGSQVGAQPAPARPVFTDDNQPVSMQTLLAEAQSWLGTRYEYGGNTRNGIDCSGFVLQVYLTALDIKLPRTSSQQQQFCSPIQKADLRPGDLLFFTGRSGSKVGHVGIYVGDGNMIHASSSKGVIITAIDSQYFLAHFHSCGRVGAYDSRLRAETTKPQPQPQPQPQPKPRPKPRPKVNHVAPPTSTPSLQAPAATMTVAEIDEEFFD